MTLKINGETTLAKFENSVFQVDYELPAPADKIEFVINDEFDRPVLIRYVYEQVEPGDVINLTWIYNPPVVEITQPPDSAILRVGKRRWFRVEFT